MPENTNSPSRPATSDDTELVECVDENREKIEREASSDSPGSWVCERLLNWYNQTHA